MQRLSLVISGLALALGGAALAQSDPAPGAAAPAPVASTLGELDANHNGVISEKESRVNLNLSNQFKILDTNQDGVLEKGEFALFLVDDGGLVQPGGAKPATPAP